MNAAPPVTFSIDADGIGWITFDDPAGRVNILNAATLAALARALDTATHVRPKALVVLSGKENTFLAGADLKQVAAFDDATDAAEFSRAGHKLFGRLADFPAPVLCAIHGACAGGGYELALACHWRIASDAPVTRIGLPETALGTIPGWGGGVRLARLIGSQPALEHILAAQLLSARDALRDGLVDQVVPAADLTQRAKAIALKFAPVGQPVRLAPTPPPKTFFADLRAQTLAKTRGRLPAPLAAIDLAEQTSDFALPAALEIEAQLFGDVTIGAVCKNLLHAFSVREAARKQTLAGWFESKADFSPPANDPAVPEGELKPARSHIVRVGVVGAGVMGSGIAHWLATHGHEVILHDAQPDAVLHGFRVIRGLFDDAVKRGKQTAADADTAFAQIKVTTDWDGFSLCDLVIEAIIENAAAKQKLFSDLARVVRPDALLASNTSALPIEEIGGHVPNPTRTLGLHFFNPVSRMSLVEIVLNEDTSLATAERALALVKSLGKTPVICRSSPGFLVTRVLFFYLNEAVRLWEDGVPTEALDVALRDFGWPMGPLRLIDEVGVDVTDFIFGEMAHYFPGRFARSTACARLLASNLRGRKNGTGSGFYHYEGRAESNNDATTRALAPAPVPSHRAPAEITAHLMAVMIDEARRCLAEGVVRSADDIDFALLSGAGFPAFRGGLMRYAEQLPQLTPMIPV